MNKVLLIVNPSAGGEKAKEFSVHAKEKLEKLFDFVEVKETQKGGDAKDFAYQASQDNYHSVFVMGGDGTVNEGISGLAHEGNKTKFGFFPLGTVNDLARALNLPLDPLESIESLDTNNTKHIDIGTINDQYFMNVVGVGTIPEAINDVDVEDKTKFGKLAYFISGFKHVLGNTSYKFKLTLDGVEQEIETSIVLVGLTNSIGGFETLLPNASVDDGFLHLVYIKDQSLIDTIKAIPDLLKGVDQESDKVGYINFKKGRIEVVDNDDLATNIDGDEGPKLPIEVSILESHLEVYYGIEKDSE